MPEKQTFQHVETKELADTIQQALINYESNVSQTISDEKSDIIRDTDWSNSLLEILKSEYDYYKKQSKENPAIAQFYLKNFAHIVENTASTALSHYLPIDDQLADLNDYINNCLNNNRQLDQATVEESLSYWKELTQCSP